MIARVIKFSFIAILTFVCISCTVNPYKNGSKTEFSDSKDSVQALAKIRVIKDLNYEDFKPGTFKKEGIELNYRFLKPQNIIKDKKYPLILIFHGSGAIGNNNTSQMGLLSKMWLTSENRKKHPVFVLSPQFPIRSSNYHIDEQRKVLASESNEYSDLLFKNIDSLLQTNKNIDRDRIYVMGFSMGGSTTMNTISKRPDLFAAAINVSGISQFDQIDHLTNLPILIVHGGLDTDNTPVSNMKFYEELKNIGKVTFWLYKDKYHNNILSNELLESIPEWIFKYKK